MHLLPGAHLLNNSEDDHDENATQRSEDEVDSHDTSYHDGVDAIYRKQDICTVIGNILKIAVPALISSMMG